MTIDEYEWNTYKPVFAPITAIPLAFDGMDTLRYHKAGWGPDEQNAGLGDWLAQAPDGDVYTIAAPVFAATYAPVPGSPGRYQKFGTVEAQRAGAPGTLATLEGSTTYAAGDFIVRGPKGDVWAMSEAKFRARYVISDPARYVGPDEAREMAALHQEAAELSAAVRVEQHTTFGDAIHWLRSEPGCRAARAGWNGKGMWLVLLRAGVAIPADFGDSIAMRDCIGMKTADGAMQPGWLASQADMLADDWVLLDPA